MTFLCLPDAAAKEAVGLCTNDKTVIIDASTAHRTAPGWVYGLPELSAERRAAIRAAKRIANPGCHATGFIVSVYPLIKAGLLPPSCPLTCFSLTGYSGGGKKMIADYESADKPEKLCAPNLYGLTLRHKHLAEMQYITGLAREPVFVPIVDDYYKGMATSVTFHAEMLNGNVDAKRIYETLDKHYAGEKFVSVRFSDGSEKLEANHNAGTNRLEITVCGAGADTLAVARFDNLGKGASGAAVQNMNIVLGFSEDAGL